MVANGSLQWPIGVSIVVSLEYLIHPSPGYCGTIPVSIRSTIRPAYHIIVDIRGALTRWLAGPRSGHAKPLRYYQPTPPLASVIGLLGPEKNLLFDGYHSNANLESLVQQRLLMDSKQISSPNICRQHEQRPSK